MIKLTKEQILLLHAQLVEVTGGSGGIRDIALLESAIESPFQTYPPVFFPFTCGYMEREL